MMIDSLLGSEMVSPEGWLVFLVKPAEGVGPSVYKIFSVWSFHDEWRLSSGVDDLSDLREFDDYFLWRQSSGTLYQLSKHNEPKLTEYARAMLLKHVLLPAKAQKLTLQFFNTDDLKKALNTAC